MREVIASCVPINLAQQGEPPDALYSLTLHGLLESDSAGPASKIVEDVLRLFQRRFAEDPDFRQYTWKQVRQAADVKDEDSTATCAVLNIAGLMNGGSSTPGPPPDFVYGTPRDIIDILACSEVAVLRDLRNRAARTASDATVAATPPATAGETHVDQPPPSEAASVGADIGLIIALKEEFLEFGSLLPNGRPHYDRDHCRYYYSFERRGGSGLSPYRIVGTFIDDKGDKGEVQAVLVTERLIQRYSPATIVMLGIAGTLHDDLRLGDVLVATIVDSYMQDVKAVPSADGKGFAFLPSGSPFRTDGQFVTHLSNLQMAHAAEFGRWCRACADDFASLVPDENERKWLLTERLVRDTPRIVAKRLASGPAVAAAKAFKDWLRTHRERSYKAIDEESGGLMRAAWDRPDALPTLVLRGISDGGDEHKERVERIGDGGLRRYAMRNAARLLWALLELELLPRTRDAERPPPRP